MLKEYELTRQYPGSGRSWSLRVSRDKLYECIESDGTLVITCYTQTDKIEFRVPVGQDSFFYREVLPQISFDVYDSYTFEISLRDFQFTWRYQVYMDGNQFLVHPPTIEPEPEGEQSNKGEPA